jgi:hypothetical protein
MAPYDPPPPHRESLLTLLLTGMAGAFFLGMLILISGGYFIYLVMVLGAMAAFASMHYLVWGKLLNDQVAGEREAEELRRRASERD